MLCLNSIQSGDIENDSFDRRPEAARGKQRAAAGRQQQEKSFEESDDGIGSEVKGFINSEITNSC